MRAAPFQRDTLRFTIHHVVSPPKRPFSAPPAGAKTPERPATEKSGQNRDAETGNLGKGIVRLYA
jgi:hypothetical protein